MLTAYARRQRHLTVEEERSLLRQAADGDRAAVDRLVASHLPFVMKIARRYRSYGIEMSDLLQEGTLGLIQAVSRFNPDRDVRLSTYAMWWIRAAIQDHVVRSWSLVRIGTTAAQRHLFFKLRRSGVDTHEETTATVEATAGPNALGDAGAPAMSWAGLAQRFGMQVAEVRALARRLAGRDLSLDVPPGAAVNGAIEGSSVSWAERLADDRATPEDALLAKRERRGWSDSIRTALIGLQPREVVILQARFLAERAVPREAIGRHLGISKHRVRQLELRALNKLRSLLPMPDPTG